MAHRLVYLAAVPKAHFNFGRVHIYIYPRWVHLDVQRVHRLAVAVQHVFIGAARRMAEHLVAHIAAIDIGKLLVGAGAGGIRNTGTAPHTQCWQAVTAPGGALIQHGYRLRYKVASQHV